jgi:hypothetical protein
VLQSKRVDFTGQIFCQAHLRTNLQWKFKGNIATLTCVPIAGAHNDNEKEERKGRSANLPRKRLKIQTLPTVVALLSLEQWHNAHGANWPDARPTLDEILVAGETCFASV